MHSDVEVVNCMLSVYEGLIRHDGYADMRVEIKILKRGQKEVVVHAGKQYRFVVDYSSVAEGEDANAKFQGFSLVESGELRRLRKGQAKSFKLAPA